jgi:hypothetical protein
VKTGRLEFVEAAVDPRDKPEDDDPLVWKFVPLVTLV